MSPLDPDSCNDSPLDRLGGVMSDAVDALGAGAAEDATVRERVASRLAEAAEAAQRALGERARDPRIHRIVGAAASSAMALSLAGAAVPTGDVVARLQEGLRELAAGSWPPEDQDPAD
ncbi:hypothetical protein [Leifsonia shinshuensis]|uniref:hypothetical protein n=1 Tax=Leifsonia shinshuensis TaxID=150026 RepID=UPI00286A4413|nr:hypothetical protein [Leifsonia shinshuensis]